MALFRWRRWATSSSRAEAIVLLIDLESRGVRLERYGGDALIRHGSPVGHEHREALRLHKPAVLALLDYVGSAESVQ
jgi:hypothetical protein